MELQKFIDENSNYLDIIKKEGYKVKHYSSQKLYLVKIQCHLFLNIHQSKID